MFDIFHDEAFWDGGMVTVNKEDQSVRNQRGNIIRDKLEMYRDEYKTTILKTEWHYKSVTKNGSVNNW